MRSPYSRTDHIAMVALATVGCLLLLAPRRDPKPPRALLLRPAALRLAAFALFGPLSFHGGLARVALVLEIGPS